MPDKKKILFIHHGHARGGAFLSLLYLLRSMDRSLYEPTICNGGDEQDPQVEAIFAAEGFTTCSCRLPRFAHTTLGSYALYTRVGWKAMLSWFRGYRKSCRNLAELINDKKPDQIHFNSLTLAPYAKVAREMNIPAIVHVREPVLEGAFGIRKNYLRRLLIENASKVIAICQDNLERLHLPTGIGIVIFNPVDFDKFDYRIDQKLARKSLGIAEDARVVLFAGSSDMSLIKGLKEFLQAMAIIHKTDDRLICLMPSFSIPQSPKTRSWTFKRRIAWLLGMYRNSDNFYSATSLDTLRTTIVACEFTYNIEKWIAASDVVCVPHIKPHFSRTIMEAGAMKKPVVGFRIGGIEEIVHNKKTGLLVDINNVEGLSRAVTSLLKNPSMRSELGEGGFIQATDLFKAEKCAERVMNVYKGI